MFNKYNNNNKLIILQPANIERKERILFNAPINIRFYCFCIICTIFDILLIFLTLIAYFYPNPFRRTPLYKQIFQKLDRFTIQFWYSIILLNLTIFFFLHIITLGASLLSIQMRIPLLFIPQLIFCLLTVLLQILIFSICTTISIISDDTIWIFSFFSLFLFLIFGSFLAISVFTFNQLIYECNDFKRILANSKSVHFKEENNKRKK